MGGGEVVSRRAHNPEIAGSTPALPTFNNKISLILPG